MSYVTSMDSSEIWILKTSDWNELQIFIPGMNPKKDLWNILFLLRKFNNQHNAALSNIFYAVGKIEIRR